MPKYTFECQCGLRFDRVLKMEEHPTHGCPACHEEAPRLLSGVGFGFAFAANVNTVSPNTGVHDLDYPSADKAVGRSADNRWQTYHDRASVKDKVRKVAGVQQLARVDGEGYTDYTSMTPSQRGARKNLVKLATDLKVRPKAQ